MRWTACAFLFAAASAQSAFASGHLQIEQAWIRSGPPGAIMLAGYATLRNIGDAALIVNAAQSEDFGDVSLHESMNENGMQRMRALESVTIAPDASVVFAPGGKHFMLMNPKRELKSGDRVKIHLDTKSGSGATAEFEVRDEAATAP